MADDLDWHILHQNFLHTYVNMSEASGRPVLGFQWLTTSIGTFCTVD
jgi:hypothetical protein